MCYFSPQDQYVCQSNQGIAEAVTSVLGGAQFPSGPFYHPRSSRCRFGHPREAAVCAGNFPDSNGISDDFKRQNRSHHTEPVPIRLEQGKQALRPVLVDIPTCVLFLGVIDELVHIALECPIWLGKEMISLSPAG